MKLQYIKDSSGNDLLEDEDSVHQVMMEWEKPYMEKCIELLEPSGNVLEIGFGLGYSATKICSCDIISYTVIECSPIVWEKFECFKQEINEKKPNLSINLVKGRWQDVLSTLDIYDTIFFDDYGSSSHTTQENYLRFNTFLYETLTKHMKIGSKLGAYSTTKTTQELDCIDKECYEYDIDIPKSCKYARGNKMYIPIITKKAECEENIKNKMHLYENLQNKIVDINKFNSTKSIYCNLLVIDNFYNNAMETRNYILTQNFEVKGNYPGMRTVSFANEHLRYMIQGYIEHFAGKITQWPMDKESYNGAYQYTTSRDRTWIHSDSWNNWAGVLYLTPNAPISSGTGIYKFMDGTRTSKEAEIRKNKKIIDQYSQDYTKWTLVDKVGNIFNRLVLFNSTQYHASLDYFGVNKNDGRLFQVFFFSTER
tara:strand:- start:1513 stop:2784 length:1272 start_codon:yes stop_codon:yes gene_type:complete